MISNRQSDILKLIVENYIKTVKPVGSKMICKKLDCSSATIRNDMMQLEKLDLIVKTHISSGRIPSEKGYRYYVDNLMEPKKMSGEDMLKLQTIFHNHALQINDVIMKSMEIIADLTNYTSIVLGSSSSDNRLKKVEIIPLNDTKLIAIVITDRGHVEHKQINLPNVPIEEIRKAVDLINNLLIGTPIDEISSKLEYEIKPVIGKYVKQHELLYKAFYNAFTDISSKSNMHMLGKSNFLKQPEFNTADKMREIITKLEDKQLVRYIKENENDIQIYIGSENNLDEDITIVKMKYKAAQEEGTIALIGPKRMEYDRVVSLLNYIKENIER